MYTKIVEHVTPVFPFRQPVPVKAAFLEFLYDRVIVGIPCFLLVRVHTRIHGTSVLFKAGIGMDFPFLVGHLQIIYQVHVAVYFHFLCGSCRTSFVIIVKIFRQRYGCIVESPEVCRVRHPGTVRCLVMEQQAERLCSVASAFKPLQRKIRGHLGRIAFYDLLFPVVNESRVIIFALAYEYIPIVETGRLRNKVPFAHYGSLVSRLPEKFGKSLLRAVENLGIVGHAVLMAVFSCQQAGPARRTYRICYETVGKDHS